MNNFTNDIDFSPPERPCRSSASAVHYAASQEQLIGYAQAIANLDFEFILVNAADPQTILNRVPGSRPSRISDSCVIWSQIDFPIFVDHSYIVDTFGIRFPSIPLTLLVPFASRFVARGNQLHITDWHLHLGFNESDLELLPNVFPD